VVKGLKRGERGSGGSIPDKDNQDI